MFIESSPNKLFQQGPYVAPRNQPLVLSARGTNEEIFHCQQSRNQRNIYVDMHLNRLHPSFSRLVVMPTMRSWNDSLNFKNASKTSTEFVKGKNIVIGVVHKSIDVIEIDVRQHNFSVRPQQLSYLTKLPDLVAAKIFEYALRYNQIKHLVAKLDWVRREVRLKQIGCSIVYRDIYSVIADIPVKKALQGGWPAPNVEQIAFFSARDSIDQTRTLAHSKVGFGVL